MAKHVCQDPEFVAASDDVCPACQGAEAERTRAAVNAERERCARLEGVAFGDWLLDWFGQNAPKQYDDEPGGYNYTQIADLSKMLERRFASAIRLAPEPDDA